MTPVSERSGGFGRQAITLFVGIVVFVLVVYTLEKTGVPRQYSIAATAIFAIIVSFVALYRGGSTRAEPFLTGDAYLSNPSGALAIVALATFPVLMLMGGAAYFLSPGFLVLLIIAPVCGIAMAGILSSRHFSASGAADLAEALVVKQKGTLSARFLALMAVVPSVALCACGLLAGSYLTGWLFALSDAMAFSLFSLLCLLVAVLGGMRSLLRFSAVAAGLLLIALNLPLLVHTINASGFPIGQLSAGFSAITPTIELESQLRSLGIEGVAQRMEAPSAIFDWSQGTQVLAGLVILFGTACLPSVVQVAAATRSTERAGLMVQRAILFAGLGGASLFALMAFTQFAFYQANLGLTLAEASVEAPYLYNWAGRDAELVKLCGDTISSAEALAGACTGTADHILNVPDFTFESRLMLAAASEIATLPFAYTALLTLALIAVLAAFTAGTALTGTGLMITAYYSTLAGKVASGRVFMMRIALLAITGISMYAAMHFITDMGAAFMFAMSLSATLFATVVAGLFHLPGSGSASMASALGIGFIICVLYYVLCAYGIDFKPETGDELAIRFPGMAEAVPPELGGVIALPAAIFVLVLAHLFAPHMGSAAQMIEED